MEHYLSVKEAENLMFDPVEGEGFLSALLLVEEMAGKDSARQ